MNVDPYISYTAEPIGPAELALIAKALGRRALAGHLLPLEPPHAARLLVLAARRAGTLRALYDPNQPRDDQGQWTSGGGALSSDDKSAVEMVSMYHGTSDDVLDAIKREGLKPRGAPGGDAWAKQNTPSRFAEMSVGDRTASVFVTEDLYYAQAYANYAYFTRGGKPIILEIRVPKDKVDGLFQKDEHDQYGWRTTSGSSIPSEWVKRVAETKRVGGRQWRDLASIDVKLYLVVLAENKDGRSLAYHPDTPLHAAADAHLSKLSVALRYAFARGRKALGDPPRPKVAALAVRRALEQVLPAILLKIVAAGGKVSLQMLAQPRAAAEPDPKKVGPFKMMFKASNPKAVAWAKKHAAKLAKDLSETTEQAIQEAIASALEGEGLRASYEAILAAVGDEDRAQLIARTETMAAANQGQRLAWEDAIDEGLLSGDERAAWIATESGACPVCEALDGKTRSMGGEYPDPGGLGPPQHPNCRCTEGMA